MEMTNPVYVGPDEEVYLLPASLQSGSGSCYLLQSGGRFLLVDSGVYSIREGLAGDLASFGCTEDNLDLIVLTHGHYDHTGNASFLRREFRAKIMMHRADIDMVESGIVSVRTRKMRPLYAKLLMPIFLLVYRSTIKDQRSHLQTFTPDVLVDDGFDLHPGGFPATVLHTPGHSNGSIALLTENGNLIAGDTLVNIRGKPTFNTMMADESFDDLDSSIDRIRSLGVKIVFPGHGPPFRMTEVASSDGGRT